MKKHQELNTRPRIKWEAIIFCILALAVQIALIALNWYANTGNLADANVGVGLLAAYGWLAWLIITACSLSYIFEEFIPSYRKAKAWDKQQQIIRAERKARNEEYNRFCDEYFPKK